MSIRISNNSVSIVLRGYAAARLDDQPLPVVVWLEIAPQHPKAVGAIWASLVNGSKEALTIYDRQSEQSLRVLGLSRRYHRLTTDAPQLYGRARPKLLRLIAPEACAIANVNSPFVTLAWPSLTPGTALAAMLEQGTSFPIRIGWGEYLLAEATARGFAKPLLVGGRAPEGYLIEPAPWEDIIADGIRLGQITLDGECVATPVTADSVFSEPVKVPVANSR